MNGNTLIDIKTANKNLEKRMEYFMGVWKDIIIKYSNNNYYSLKPHLQEAIDTLLVRLEVTTFNKNKSISSQLDKPLVVKIIRIAASLGREDVLDSIYKRTRSSMFQYFHYQDLIDAYIRIGKSNKSLDVMHYMLNKEHYAYWYAVYNLNRHFVDDVCKKNSEFKSQFNQIRETTIIKLLMVGERIDITNVNREELINLVTKINVVQPDDYMI